MGVLLQSLDTTDPEKMGPQIVEEGRKKWLRLLDNCSGAFRPSVLTALVGSSGAGKTTLMDVLAGRKTSKQPFQLLTFKTGNAFPGMPPEREPKQLACPDLS